MTAEIAHALLSSCMPSIFSLAKHLLRVYVPSFSAATNRLDRTGTPARCCPAHVDTPIESNNYKGSSKLEISKSDIGDSEKGLTIGMNEKAHTVTQADYKKGVAIVEACRGVA